MNYKTVLICRKAVALMLSLILLLCQTNISYASVSNENQEANTEIRKSTTRLEELARAVNLGFGNNIDSTENITYAEYIEMLDKLVMLIYPDDEDKLLQWQSMYREARICYEELTRSNAMYLIYALAHDILGGEYANLPEILIKDTSWNELHGYMGERWNEYETNIKLFDDTGDYEQFAGTEQEYSRHANAYMFSFAKCSANGYPLFDYDAETNSMRTADILNWQEAMLSVIRLYESPLPEKMETTFVDVEDVASYNEDIITEELLKRAEYMPEPTYDNLPYYTGVCDTYEMWDNDYAHVTEARFCVWADMGFNYIRMQLSCLDFFDEEITQVDEAHLQELDRMISWALKYGIHMSIQFTDYPGHIQVYELDEENGQVIADTDFYTNTAKQEQTALLWQTIAKRYKGIPNNVISFVTNHEPDNPGRSTGTPFEPYTDEDIERVSKYIINAVKEIDSERLQIYAPKYNQCADMFMEGADVAITNFNSPQRFNYWSMINDFSYKGGYLPDWPFYEIPNMLEEGKESIVIGGFLPSGTNICVVSKDAWTHSDTFPTLTLKSVSGTGDTVLCEQQMADEGGTLSCTLTEDVASLELSVDFSGVVMDSFTITLPLEYATDKYYYSGCDFVYGDQGGEVTKVNDSVITIRLGCKYSDYLSMSDTIREETCEMAYILDENSTTDITVTSDCKYTSNYGYTKETLQKMQEQFNAQLDVLGCAGMNYEFGPGTDFLQDTVLEFYDDLLDVFYQDQYGWAVFFPVSITLENYYIGTERTAMDKTGMLVDQELLSLLQKYMADRPEIMVEVPKPVVCEHDYENITTNPTATTDGSIVSTCKKCGKKNAYTVLEKLGNAYSVSIYEDEEYQTLSEQLGEFDNVDSLNEAIADKEGYLLIELMKNSSMEAFPKADGILGTKVITQGGKKYQLSLNAEEMKLSSDTSILTDVNVTKDVCHIEGNASNLLFNYMTLNGGKLTTEGVNLIMAGDVTVNSEISGVDAIYLDKNISITENEGVLEWQNKYGNANVFINAPITNISKMFIYGGKIFINSNGSLTVDEISGIYGDVYLQKENNDLADLTVNKTMSEMIWQIRIHPYAVIPESFWLTEYVEIEEGTIIAYLSDESDNSCIEKLGIIMKKDSAGNDSWDDYSNKEVGKNNLYFGAAPECKHINTEKQNALEVKCKENGYTGDVYCLDCEEIVEYGEPVIAVGHHNYTEGVCTCGAQQLKQTEFGFSSNQIIKAYGDASFVISAQGAVEGSVVTYESSDTRVATVDNTGKVTIISAGTATITAKASESGDYAKAEASIELIVEKLQSAPNMPEKTINVANSISKLNQIELPTSWEWSSNEAGKDLIAGGQVKAIAVYVGSDRGNYETETVEITIIRKAKNLPIKYNIKFDKNGATSGSMSLMKDKQYGKTYKLVKNRFKRVGYTFAGWNTKKNGKGKTYKNKASIKNLTKDNGKTVVLYAQWKVNTYNIKYNLSGGKNNSQNPKKYNINTKTIKLKTPKKKGYIFKGWYSDKKCTKKVTQIKKGSTGKVTLYAKWKKK